MENVRIVAGIILIAVGLFVYITATFGLFRFHYVLNRMHAAALGDTLGILFVRLGLIICFLWLASPVSSHLLAKAEFVTFKHIKSECEVVEK